MSVIVIGWNIFTPCFKKAEVCTLRTLKHDSPFPFLTSKSSWMLIFRLTICTMTSLMSLSSTSWLWFRQQWRTLPKLNIFSCFVWNSNLIDNLLRKDHVRKEQNIGFRSQSLFRKGQDQYRPKYIKQAYVSALDAKLASFCSKNSAVFNDPDESASINGVRPALSVRSKGSPVLRSNSSGWVKSFIARRWSIPKYDI